MPGRFLNFFRPIGLVMPEVKAPTRRVSFNERLIWTGLVLVVYLIMTEIPLYGAVPTGVSDPFYYLRVIFASNRGSLMELGIQPIVTAGMIIQLLGGSGLIQVDQSNPEDRALMSGVTKFFSLIMTSFIAIAYLLSGAYGTDLTLDTSLLIFIQLFFAGIVLMLLDELLQKGWGFGSGISLFIAAGVAQKILWNTLSPLPFPAEEEMGKSTGALIAYIQSLFNGENPLNAFFYRARLDAPTMLGLLSTAVLFLVVIYFQVLKVDLPVSYARYRGFRGRYPVKFLYVSNIPVILVSALLMDISFVGQIIWSRFNSDNSHFLLNLLATYDPVTNEATGGLVKYVIGPRNFTQFLADPLRGLIYAGLMIGLCVIFAVIWVGIGGLGPKDVAEKIVNSGMQIPGFRRSVKPIQSVLERYIPSVTVLGAITVGAIASISDFFGVFGSGMGILLTVGILYQLYETIAGEQLAEMYPFIRRLIGKE